MWSGQGPELRPSSLVDEVKGTKPPCMRHNPELGIEKEIELLLGLLKNQTSRQPGSKENFNAIRALIDADMSGAAETLADIIASGPLKAMPASVGMDLNVLLKQKTQLGPVFKAAAQKLRESSDTRIGKAFVEGEKG